MEQRNSIPLLLTYISYQILLAIFNIFYNQSHNFYLLETIIGILCMLVIVYLNHRFSFKNKLEHKTIKLKSILLWSILGMVGALIIQIGLSRIESELFHFSSYSANTNLLLEIVHHYPYYILIPGITAPVMEELIFRKVLFGNFSRFIPFLPAALVSSLLFSLAHMDGHFLIYASIGLLFCYIYYRTGTIITSIFNHIFLNLFIILLSSL
ncbi:type II CAAX endopeptidase family protein [Ligilactobacillus salivarius]|uniref:CPBP family intramembrane glutamic endopeptidase n=1 Tax=Ligilactobacillus salivarius TaxID=1624 RepID=UPI0030F7FF2C